MTFITADALKTLVIFNKKAFGIKAIYKPIGKMKPNILVITGPQGTGNHVFSKVLSAQSMCMDGTNF